MIWSKDNPFHAAATAAPYLLGEADFRELYAAAAFAVETQLFLDTRVTIAWALCSDEAARDSRPYFNSFTSSLRGWLRSRGGPPAWIYAHERSPAIGLHTHIALSVPSWSSRAPKSSIDVPIRQQFRVWAQMWADWHFPDRVARAIRVRGPSQPSIVEHWRAFHYLLKGYDPRAIIPNAAAALPEEPILLADLMAFYSADPGHVSLHPRCASSRSLSQQQRKLGTFEVAATRPKRTRSTDEAWPFPASLRSGSGAPARAPYLSPYDRGSRDVRELYSPEFLDIVPGRTQAIEKGRSRNKAEVAVPLSAQAAINQPFQQLDRAWDYTSRFRVTWRS